MKIEIENVYVKRSHAYLIILEGEGDFIMLKPKEKFWLKNNSRKIIKFLAIDVLPIEDEDIVWEDKK